MAAVDEPAAAASSPSVVAMSPAAADPSPAADTVSSATETATVTPSSAVTPAVASAAASAAASADQQPTGDVLADLKKLEQWLKNEGKLKSGDKLLERGVSHSRAMSYFQPFKPASGDKTHLCALCWKPYTLSKKGATTNAKDHLSGKHPELGSMDNLQSYSAKRSLASTIEAGFLRARTAATAVATTQEARGRQQRLEAVLPATSSQTRLVENVLMRMSTQHNLPFSMIEWEGLHDLVEILLLMSPCKVCRALVLIITDCPHITRCVYPAANLCTAP